MYTNDCGTANRLKGAIARMALGNVAGVVTIERQIAALPESEEREVLHNDFESKAQPLVDAAMSVAGGVDSYAVKDFQERIRNRTGSSYEFSLTDMVVDDIMSRFVRKAAEQFPKVAPTPAAAPTTCDCGCEDEDEDLADDGDEGSTFDFSDGDIIRDVMEDPEVQRVVGRRFLLALAERVEND